MSPRSSRPSRREVHVKDIGSMADAIAEQLNKQATEPNLIAYNPHSKQLPFHQSQKQIRAYIGGNRSGKSTAGIVEDLWWCTKRHPYRRLPVGPVRGRVVGVSYVEGIEKILLPEVKRWVVPSDLINGSWEDSWDNELRTLFFDNKSFLEFMSSEQLVEKHAGVSRHFVHIDEEIPRIYYQENLLRLVDTEGSMWLTLTPVQGMTWIYDEIYEPWEKGTLSDGIEVFEVDVADNPHVSAAGRALITQGINDPDELEMRTKGKFIQRGGNIFPEFDPDLHSTVEEYWRPSRMDVRTGKIKIYVSIDHGLKNPTAIYWHAVNEKGNVITFHEYYRSGALVKDHAEYIHNYEKEILGLEPNDIYLRTGDPAMKQRNAETGMSIRQVYLQHDIILALDNLPKDVKTGINQMHGYLRVDPLSGRPHWQLVKGACPSLERELQRLHWKVAESARLRDSLDPREEVHKKDDHAFDSCRYFFTLLPNLSADPDEFAPGRLAAEKLIAPKGSYLDTRARMTQWSQKSEGFVIPDSEFKGMEYD